MINYEATMSAIGNDKALLEVLIGIFLEDYPIILTDLNQASADQNGDKVYAAAHRLKGLVGNFHASAPMQKLADIELAARSTQTVPDTETLSSVSHLLELTAQDLRRYLPTA